LALMLLASVAAVGSLHGKDAVIERRKRAKYAYLYFDGALGLVPQFVITLVIALTTWISVRDMWTPSLAWVIGGVAICGWIYTLYLKFNKEPCLLFAANGYSTVPVHFWTRRSRMPANVAPWSRYTLIVILFGGILAWLLVICFWVVSYGIAIGLAMLKLRVG
jgi:hypothetical protein